eukprot:225369_1
MTTWKCTVCSLINDSNRIQCQACFTRSSTISTNGKTRCEWKRFEFPEQIDWCVENWMKPIKINNIILFAGNTGIYKWDAANDESKSQFIKYPKQIFHNGIHNGAMPVYSADKEYIYLISKWQNKCLKFNAATNTYTLFTNMSQWGQLFAQNKSCSCFMLDEKLHFIGMIGYSRCVNHVTWKEHTNVFQKINSFKYTSVVNEAYYDHKLLHIPSRQQILLFGGVVGSTFSYTNYIHSFDYETDKWITLNVKLPKQHMRRFGCVATSNGRFVLVLGGIDTNYSKITTQIFILNLDQTPFKFVRSAVSCPIFFKSAFPSDVEAFNILKCDENAMSIISGYLEYCARLFDVTLPQEIISLIYYFHQTEYIVIHIVNRNGTLELWEMELNNILRSTKDDIDFNNIYTGICKTFSAEKGFGWITIDNGLGDVFVDESEIYSTGLRILTIGQRVEFQMSTDDDGTRKALNVTGTNRTFV